MSDNRSDKHAGYEDGSEGRLYELFSENRTYELDKLDWAMYYHLTPRRQNILHWYTFRKGARLLEVGAGCGAVTGLFLDSGLEVTAVELEEKRARVIRERYRKHDNLKVVTGPIEKVGSLGKFDYVTSIGVLEYAGKYNSGKEPYLSFLGNLCSLLKPDGILILAIENKYGLKYWSGSGEDHTGRPFDSIEGYPGGTDIRTFGKRELTKLLESAGFGVNRFYYPFPDYKLPNEIFSDTYLPSAGHRLRPGGTPFYDATARGLKIFRERLVADQLSSDGYMDMFANSFLVFSSRAGAT